MLRVVQIGVGPLGQRIVRCALKQGVRIVAAVDKSPEIAGKDLGSVCGVKKLGVTVQKDLKSALKGKKADVAVLATVSDLKTIAKQIQEIAKSGLNIVSTCEELSFPWKKKAKLSAEIDKVCRKHGIACVGTGVNPGFLMDYLPCVLTSVCEDVRKVVVERIQDASSRRIPFQQKIGAGLTRAQFKKKVSTGTLRHVGLVESMHMIAHTMGWKLSRTTESLRPVIAKRRITSGYTPIAKGVACGVEQVGRGYVGKKQVIKLHFRAAVGEKESRDTVKIAGSPPIESTIKGGVNGDVATCAITINACRTISRIEPGLKSMLDLPVLCQ